MLYIFCCIYVVLVYVNFLSEEQILHQISTVWKSETNAVAHYNQEHFITSKIVIHTFLWTFWPGDISIAWALSLVQCDNLTDVLWHGCPSRHLDVAVSRAVKSLADTQWLILLDSFPEPCWVSEPLHNLSPACFFYYTL